MNVSENIPYYLEIIRNKGNCFKTLRIAKRALAKIQPLLQYQDWWSMHIALAHMEIGEGPNELNEAVKKVQIKYASGK